MVLYFTSDVVSPPYTIFMGLDKLENEKLIKWGWPEDVWFHVNNMSSPHVYLRLYEGQTLDDVPSIVFDDAAQLVKAHSVQANKRDNVEIVYTLWTNLKKTDSMQVGQVGFHRDSEVRKIHVSKRNNDIINRLNKTKRELQPDLQAERQQRDEKMREDKKREHKQKMEVKKAYEKKKKDEAKHRGYSSLMKKEKMTSNKSTDGNDSDDFMKRSWSFIQPCQMKWLSHTYKCWHYMKNMFQIIQKCAEYASATFFITIFIKRREEEVGNQAMQKLLNFENSNTYSYKWNDLQSYLQELSTTCESKQFDPGSFCRWQNRIIIKSK